MKILNFFILVFLCSSCTMEPKYETPESPVELEEEKNEVQYVRWEDFFQNKEIKNLIEVTLENNRDLRVAYLNIEVARGSYEVVQSSLMPSISAAGSLSKSSTPYLDTGYQIGAALASYEFDVFGRLRSLKKAAQENLLAQEEVKNSLKISLISDVVNTYIQFLTLSENVQLLKNEFGLESEKYKILKLQEKVGLVSKANLLSMQNELEQKRSDMNSAIIQLNSAKTLLSLLAGIDVSKNLKGISVSEIKINEYKLSLLPSTVMLSRPDIRQAEHNLKAANANIGAARAAFFPSITITGQAGYQSQQLSSLFSGSAWQYSPSITLPIFTGGVNFANLSISKANKEIAIANYEKSIQVAFKEALDALTSKKVNFEDLKSSEEMVRNAKNIFKIQEQQYKLGATSKLDFINAKISLNTAKRLNNSVKQKYLASIILTYKVLGQADVN